MPETEDRDTILDTLHGIAQGRFVREVTEQMQALVKEMNRVAELGGGKPKGKLVLTLNLALDRGIMSVEPAIKITTPNPIRALTIMYPTADGRLTKNDTRQGMLALGEGKDVSTRVDVRDIRERQANDR